MDFSSLDPVINFAYEYPSYSWVIMGLIFAFLGLLIEPVRKWFVIPGIAFFITGLLVFLNVVAPEAYLIQSLCTAGFLAVIIACYE